MFGQGLRQVQETLNRKADTVQREFSVIGQQLEALGQKIKNTPGADSGPLLAEREALYDKQRDLADEANLWRDRARGALRQQNDEAIRAYLNELLATHDETVRPAVEHMLHLLDAPEEELITLAQSQLQAIAATTPAGRFIERTRTAYELRGQDPAPRRLAAFEFANRSGVAQNDQALAELEAVVNDPDPLVSEMMTLTLIQIHRFRALRLGDLDVAHNAILHLTRLTHPAVIPVLIEVAATARTGFVRGETGMVEANNDRSREAALTRLAEWHTPEAQAAVQAGQRERERRLARK
jgi:hypothetical protein